VRLEVSFPRQSVRYVRVSSLGGTKPLYPTTLTELEILAPGDTAGSFLDELPPDVERVKHLWRNERALRALGVFAPPDASRRIVKALGPAPAYSAANSPMVQAGLRALGRLRQPAGFDYLVKLLDNTDWARYAALALCRLEISKPEDLAKLRSLAPRIIANLPGNHDTFMLHELESHHHLTRHLLDVCQMRRAACEHTMRQLGVEFDAGAIDDSLSWSPVVGRTGPHHRFGWQPAGDPPAADRLHARRQGIHLPCQGVVQRQASGGHRRTHPDGLIGKPDRAVRCRCRVGRAQRAPPGNNELGMPNVQCPRNDQ